jgi:hypothetical protein
MMETRPTSSQQSLLTLGALAIILVFGCLLRFQALAYTEQDYIPHGDAARYLLYAYNIRNFGLYSQSDFQLHPPDKDAGFIGENIKPDALVAPAYPLFLRLLLGGEYTRHQFDTVRLIQVILSSITILLAFFVFAAFGRIYGLVAAVLTAASPHLINMNLFLLTETLFCFFLLGLLFLLSRMRSDSGIPLLLATGLFLGFATLTRPWILGFLLILLLYIYFTLLRTRTGKTLFLALGFMFPVVP